MLIPANLNEIQIEILSILFYTGSISFSKLEKILEYDIFKTSMGKDFIKKITEVIINLENKASASYNNGMEHAKLFDSINKNILLPKSTLGNLSYNKQLPYTLNYVPKDRSISRIEHNILNLEFLGLVIFDDKDAEFDEINIDKKFKNIISLSSEGIAVSKKIIEERRIDFRAVPSQRDSIFIASAFGHDDLDMLYERELLPACEKYEYNPIRVDIKEPAQTITEYIIESILKSECVIADLTYARPSVYFEVGFAHGQGIPLLLTCRKDHYKGKTDTLRVHFDLEQYKISYWSIDKNKNFKWALKMAPIIRLKNLIRTNHKINNVNNDLQKSDTSK